MQGVCRKRGRTGQQAVQPRVPHIRQEESWDCGLACALMVLRSRWYQSGLDLPSLKDMVEDANRSIWTVDLLYLLTSAGVRASMFTTTLGVDPAYEDKNFYQQSFCRDRKRVTQLFHPRTQAECGVRIQKVRTAGSFGGQPTPEAGGLGPRRRKGLHQAACLLGNAPPARQGEALT